MNGTKILNDAFNRGQRGAALITVLFISLLLLTATAAMLSAVGANSRNTTDILSETKAYYAAETGIQASVNVLRNYVEGNGSAVDYTEAAGDPDLSTWLPTYVSGQVPIGTETGYSINVTNPGAGAANINYTSVVKFTGSTGEVVGQSIWIPSAPPATPTGTPIPRTRITIDTGFGPAPTPPNTKIADFTVETFDGGASMISGVTFRIDFVLTAPRNGVASIYGTINQTNASSPITATFQSRDYRLLGSIMQLCTAQDSGCSTTTPLTLTLLEGLLPVPLFISSSTSFSPEPYRLKVVSTGYGPNGAKKTLEAIVRRNFFDGYDPPGTMALIGPNSDNIGPFIYDAGNSNIVYSGGDCGVRCIPSFAVTDPVIYNEILNNTPNNVTLAPAPQLVDFSVLPSWLQSPSALDTIIRQLRVAAQNSNRYFGLADADPSTFGSYASGTGITFCEGNCSLNTVNGGGLLVVTGKLTINGSFDFNGLILIVGQEGWRRTGSGSGNVTGNFIIAPYNQLVGGSYIYPYTVPNSFLAPRYDTNGGGSSITPYTDVNFLLDTTSALSDIVAGVAEK